MPNNKYPIEIKYIPSVRVAYMTYEGNITKANALFYQIYKAINFKVNGSPFYIYREIDLETMTGKMDICENTSQEPKDPKVLVMKTRKIKAITTLHIGPYHNIHKAYSAIKKYAQENNIELLNEAREIFIKGPSVMCDPNLFETEVAVEIKQ